MSENSGEHHAHHSSSSSAMWILPLSILLASVIIGYSMMAAATSVNNGFMELSKNMNAGSGTVLPTPDAGTGTLNPPTPSYKIAELSKDAPGKTGKDDAPLVLVEYSDYQCPYCKAFYHNTEKTLVEKYVKTGKLQIIYKDYPLSFHPMAAPSANAARCAGDQGKYWEMHDKIFEETYKIDPSATTQYTVDDLKTWGKELGLNATTFNACVDADTHSADIQSNLAQGSASGVTGTPGFFLGKRDGDGQLIIGAQPLATFEAAINALLAE